MIKTPFIAFLLFGLITYGQTGKVNIIELDSLRNGSDFEVINKYEQRWDSLSIVNLNRRIERIKSSAYFQDSLSIQNQIDSIKKIRDFGIRYMENRSRFLLIEYENGKFNDSLKVDHKSKAICLFEDSSLSLLTGFGIFGGVYFKLDIELDHFNGTVTIDEYKQKVFKNNLYDTTLVSSLEIPLKNEVLYLDHQPQLYNGEILNGLLEFNTTCFYKSSNIDPYLSKDYYDPKEVDHIYYIGELEFTCKVLEQMNRIE